MARKTKNPSPGISIFYFYFFTVGLEGGGKVGGKFLSVFVIALCLKGTAVTLIQTRSQPSDENGPAIIRIVSFCKKAAGRKSKTAEKKNFRTRGNVRRLKDFVSQT